MTKKCKTTGHERMRQLAARYNVQLEVSTPGIGRRRYEFTMRTGRVCVVYGLHDAEIFLRGVELGCLDTFEYGFSPIKQETNNGISGHNGS